MGFETPTHNVESENARTFILTNFAAGSLSNVILASKRVYVQQGSHVVCVSAMDQYVFLSLHEVYMILCKLMMGELRTEGILQMIKSPSSDLPADLGKDLPR